MRKRKKKKPTIIIGAVRRHGGDHRERRVDGGGDIGIMRQRSEALESLRLGGLDRGCMQKES